MSDLSSIPSGRRLLAAALVLIAFLAAPAAAAQTVYDHFDTAALDDRLWTHDAFGGQQWQASSLLHVANPSGSMHAWFSATQEFRGDCGADLSWQDFQTTGANWEDAQLELGSAGPRDYIYYLMRFDDLAGGGIGFFGLENGVSIGSFTVASAAAAGVFRITRTGSRIEGWYDVGGGWVLLGSFTSAYAGDLSPAIGVGRGVVHVAFDVLSCSGTPVYPVPDLQANGSDGPLVLAYGAQLDLTIALEANLFAGVPSSEYVVAFRQTGPPFWYGGASGWRPSPSPVPFAVGPLASRPVTPALSTSVVPRGTYAVYYGALPTSGLDDLRTDSVLLTVQ